jgi:hypothetical protein
MLSVVLPPISSGCCFWQLGEVPPPHSSVKTIFLPSLLNTAVCHSEKFVSAAAAMRFGFSGFEMSTSRPWLAQAPASSPISGYAVTSWQLRGPAAAICAIIALSAPVSARARRAWPARVGAGPSSEKMRAPVTTAAS